MKKLKIVAMETRNTRKIIVSFDKATPVTTRDIFTISCDQDNLPSLSEIPIFQTSNRNENWFKNVVFD